MLIEYVDKDPGPEADVRKYLKLWNWDWSQLAILGVDEQEQNNRL